MNEIEQEYHPIVPWLREDYRRPFESGMAWGMERCRTDEERLLYPFLLVALSPYTALVAHRRMPEGGTVSFTVRFSRVTTQSNERLQWNVSDGATYIEEGERTPLISLATELIRETPWKAALQVVSALQSDLMGSEPQ